MDVKSLCEFLAEAELQQYYSAMKSELKVSVVVHLKYTSDEDLKQIGMSRPEIRRLRKFYDKYYPNGYLGKIKRMLQHPKPDMFNVSSSSSTTTGGWSSADNYTNKALMDETSSSPPPPSNKHIIPADAITINKQLGVGEFGIVQQGVWTMNGNERLQVAIKCLSRIQSNPIEFLKEAAIMHSIEHENIVRFFGVVLDTDSLMLVTELAPLRSLLECLKDSGLKVSFLTVPTLCDFASQICNGMTYLENKRLIHRDLAARNILVFNKDKVKISDFGLSRSLGVGKDYYQTNFNVNLKLPIAWCAPECINFLRFTNASDVWAYAVCLWEMFSYGFQPWAALTGHQILEAIDEPNFQRLDQPDCCPRDFYGLMLKCWQHDPLKRPRFVDIYAMLPDLRPEQVKTIAATTAQDAVRKDYLMYRQNEVVTVLDKESHAPLWRGVLNTGKTGLFHPTNTVAYLSQVMLPTNPFTRTFERGGSKRRLRSEMISKPQNDLKHTGHIGIDGAFFGDISFLTASSPGVNTPPVPRQVVTPYKPSEDIEQTPLLTPTSPDIVPPIEGYATNGNNLIGGTSRFDFTNPFQNLDKQQQQKLANGGTAVGLLGRLDASVGALGARSVREDATENSGRHEYHEISEDEEEVLSPDLGLSLTDEMERMFQSMSAATVSHDAFEMDRHCEQGNEFAESKTPMAANKLNLPVNCSSLYKTKKKSTVTGGTVKPLSIKDDKILNHAIEIAHEMGARSMNDLVPDPVPATQSPRRKFSFKFPLGHTSSSSAGIVGGSGVDQSRSLDETGMHNDDSFSNKFGARGRHFSDELKNVTDIQESLTDQHLLAYNSLVEKPSTGSAFKQQLNDMERCWRDGTTATTARNDTQGHTLMRVTSSIKDQTPTKPPHLNLSATTRISSTENLVDGNEACESPTYLTGGDASAYGGGNNPPLPPRDRFKPKTLPSQKRHVRKHALIIPATGTLRTLDRIGANHLSEENRLRLKKVADMSKTDSHADTNLNLNSDTKISFGALSKLQVVESAPQSPVYQNFSMIPDADSASMNFESIVERKDLNEVKDMLEGNRRSSMVVDCCDGVVAVADRGDVNVGDATAALSNSVSCEDLLEFSEKKPNGRERGAESDEVRIMVKVLGPKINPKDCLEALDLMQWSDVHKAIKIIMLSNLMDKRGPVREQLRLCAEQLENNDWNLQDTAINM